MSDLLLMRCGGHERAFISPLPPTDPDFASVVLLVVNDNQADATTSFDDQSNSNHTMTAVGNVQYDTAQAPSGMSSSALLDAAGDGISTPDHADWDLSTTDFTMECMMRFNALGHATLFSVSTDTPTGSWLWLFNNTAKELRFFFNGSANTPVNRAWDPATNTWYHVAITRASGVWRQFVDGTILGTSATDATAIDANSNSLFVGSTTNNALVINGWLSNCRMTLGVARYTANFTPPTLPLPTS